ncbi:hypothetical protein [Thalassospira lohafexi]|uniref:Uncharacterized protein n=1 Tax=Thalassospira lohafexi TaxID=744227 RepID=A0A2N3L0P7_9PROT|nr:hypothetical protein [Thalassospira lohafexi]PKR56371.1 hypothetical protein COO92_21440 [Thalassospira lohafexi]
MSKDCNGADILPGNKVKHCWGSWPRGEDAGWPSYREKMESAGIPASKYLLADGFDGTAKVVAVHPGAIEVEHPGMRGRIPVFASAYCEVTQ